MSRGKTIEIYLVNGKINEIVIAELTNWNGKAIKIPRNMLVDCKRDEIKMAGVYFLFCKEEDAESVYIGEAENIKERLINHINDYKAGKETYYWNTAVAFVGESLNKANIRYMEDKLVEIARSSKKYNVLTKTTYKNTKMKDSQKDMADEFVDNIKLIIGTLGYNVLEDSQEEQSNTQLYFCRGNNGDAQGFPSSGGFTVLKDSIISDHVAKSYDLKTREKLIKAGIIVDLKFVQNYEFGSPSGASCTILGRSSNGNEDWKTKDGVSLKDSKE